MLTPIPEDWEDIQEAFDPDGFVEAQLRETALRFAQTLRESRPADPPATPEPPPQMPADLFPPNDAGPDEPYVHTRASCDCGWASSWRYGPRWKAVGWAENERRIHDRTHVTR